MSVETINAVEWCGPDDGPFLDGDYIRNLLILGRQSKNPCNATETSRGDLRAPKRKFNRVVDATEEVAKLVGPSYILHKPMPRSEEDLLGHFENPRASDKGARADLKCRRIAATEQYHPQVIALRDNVEHKRPFGGFSPKFDLRVDTDSGETQTILRNHSIDLVPAPGSLASAIEGDAEQMPATQQQVDSLESRLTACEAFIAGAKSIKAAESHIASVPPPSYFDGKRGMMVESISLKEFIRG